MRQILATQGGELGAPSTDRTLRVEGATSCGQHVEISATAPPGGGPSDLLATVAAEPRPAPPGRPWVLLNMVCSAEGASAGVEGRSASLSGAADRQLFHALRSIADVVLAGATTVRAESYGPPRIVEGAERLRKDRGQATAPRLAVVTASLRLDPTARLFTESTPATRPIVLTTSQAMDRAPDRAATLRKVADVRPVGTDDLDWTAALQLLREEFAALSLLVEGGPTVNAQLAALGLLDELRLTVAPLLVGGAAQRILAAVPTLDPTALSLDRIFEEDGFLLLRYLRSRMAPI